MKKIFFTIPLFLIGCASNGVADYRSTGVNEKVVLEPTIGNGYRGVLVEMSASSEGALLTRAHEICSNRGGLKEGPHYSHTVPLGWKFYNYRCAGFQMPTVQSIQPVMQQPNFVQPASMNAAKSKCEDLGFKAGTEAFGNCVLRLSK